MDSDYILIGLLFGAGLVLLNRRNPQPGTFSPNAPSALQSGTAQILPLSVSPAGIAFIEGEESFSGTPYSDAGHTDIGFGHQIQPGQSYTSISRLDATDLLSQDLVTVQDAIANNVAVALNQNQYDALADFIYNVGVGAFKGSTLLQLLNQGNYAGAAAQFSQWVNSGGRRNQTLVARRAADQGLFTS